MYEIQDEKKESVTSMWNFLHYYKIVFILKTLLSFIYDHAGNFFQETYVSFKFINLFTSMCLDSKSWAPWCGRAAWSAPWRPTSTGTCTPPSSRTPSSAASPAVPGHPFPPPSRGLTPRPTASPAYPPPIPPTQSRPAQSHPHNNTSSSMRSSPDLPKAGPCRPNMPPTLYTSGSSPTPNPGPTPSHCVGTYRYLPWINSFRAPTFRQLRPFPTIQALIS